MKRLMIIAFAALLVPAVLVQRSLPAPAPSGSSFPSGTPVHTRSGAAGIDTVAAGTEIRVPGGWAVVRGISVRESPGLVVLQGEGLTLRTTPEHPFLLTAGENLAERSVITGLPDPADLGGVRWVAAAELTDWFWGETTAGKSLLELKAVCATIDDPVAQGLATFALVPRSQLHRIPADGG